MPVVLCFDLPPVAKDEPRRDRRDGGDRDRYRQIGAGVPILPCRVGLSHEEHLVTVVDHRVCARISAVMRSC